MKKKGAEDLLAFVIYLVLALFVLISLFYFIRNSASGDVLKEQILAKQIALLLSDARPGTEFIISKEKFIVDVEDGKVKVRGKPDAPGYVYNFHSRYSIRQEVQQGEILKLNVS